MTDSTAAGTTPAATPEGARRASPYPDLLYSGLDQAGIAACRSRMATMLRLMQAMTFDTTRSVISLAPCWRELMSGLGSF